jgi:gluconolactonase
MRTARGEFLTTCYDSGTIGRIAADRKDLPAYTHDKDGNPIVGPNDFAPDRRGGIYFTASGTQGSVINGRIFYIAADGTITQKAADVHSANGIVVCNDGKILHAIETEAHRLIQFKVGPDGSLSDRQVFLILDDLTKNVVHIYPDGVKGELFRPESPRCACSPRRHDLCREPQRRIASHTQAALTGYAKLAFSPDDTTLYVMALDQLDIALPG